MVLCVACSPAFASYLISGQKQPLCEHIGFTSAGLFFPSLSITTIVSCPHTLCQPEVSTLLDYPVRLVVFSGFVQSRWHAGGKRNHSMLFFHFPLSPSTAAQNLFYIMHGPIIYTWDLGSKYGGAIRRWERCVSDQTSKNSFVGSDASLAGKHTNVVDRAM